MKKYYSYNTHKEETLKCHAYLQIKNKIIQMNIKKKTKKNVRTHRTFNLNLKPIKMSFSLSGSWLQSEMLYILGVQIFV